MNVMIYTRSFVNFTKRMFKSKVLMILLCVTIFIVCIFNYRKKESFESRIMNFYESSSKTPESFLEQYMLEKIENFKGGIEGNSECKDDRSNLTAVVLQYRALVNKFVSMPNSDEDFSANFEDICLLPTGILVDERFHIMVERVRSARQACMESDDEIWVELNPVRLLQDSEHHIVMCRNPKVASTTLGIYANVLHIYTVMNKYLTVLRGITDHYLLRMYSIPAITPEQIRTLERRDKLAFATVRHPFQRTVSCYVNKVEAGHHYFNRMPRLYKDMLKYSSMSPSEAKAYMKSKLEEEGIKSFALKQFSCPQKFESLDEENFQKQDNLERPTFRGFVLAIVTSILVCKGSPRCLLDIEIHYRGQAVKCSACRSQYDAIVKAESLQEDMEFIEQLLGLPPVWMVQMKLMAANQREIRKNARVLGVAEDQKGRPESMRANISNKEKSYESYMSELTVEEMYLLYTAYYHDFAVFGYDPCKGLQNNEI